MGKNSRIEWTHHTFNPWWGCVRVSPACKNCYAEAWAKRVGKDVWGAKASRRFFGDAHWAGPIRWNNEAEAAGERRRVFCASMADVFEDRRDLDEARARLWPLITATPWLDWLLLTKRPECAQKLAPWNGKWPPNVLIGTTAETQLWASRRLPVLAEIPARVRFVSCEPLLGALNLTEWLGTSLGWVIAGGESGPKARKPDPSWFRALRDQCISAGVPFHFKQWGNWAPVSDVAADGTKSSRPPEKGLIRLTKALAGRTLDGAVWDGVPAP